MGIETTTYSAESKTATNWAVRPAKNNQCHRKNLVDIKNSHRQWTNCKIKTQWSIVSCITRNLTTDDAEGLVQTSPDESGQTTHLTVGYHEEAHSTSESALWALRNVMTSRGLNGKYIELWKRKFIKYENYEAIEWDKAMLPCKFQFFLIILFCNSKN